MSKNVFDVTLVVNSKLIKFRVKVPKGPSKYIQIIDKDGEDITNKVEPYLLPNIINITSNELEMEEIDIMLSDGTNKIYRNDKKEPFIRFQ